MPLLAELFAGLTAAIRTGTSYKEEIRLIVQDSFSELANAFNALVGFVSEEVDKQGLGKALLFVIDGTDRLRRDEAETFFIHDIHQLRLVHANFVYCAPITTLIEEERVAQSFDGIFKFPMVRLSDKGAAELLDEGRDCLQEINEGPITEPVARTAVRRLAAAAAW